MLNFLNVCNIVTITFQCFRLLILTSVSVLIYQFFSSWDFVFLSFCVPGNFLLDAGHYQFYLFRCWILYSCKYFCIPIHILELFSGILLNYLEKVWSFWAWQNHTPSRAATEARPFYVLCPVFHEPWSFPSGWREQVLFPSVSELWILYFHSIEVILSTLGRFLPCMDCSTLRWLSEEHLPQISGILLLCGSLFSGSGWAYLLVLPTGASLGFPKLFTFTFWMQTRLDCLGQLQCRLETLSR